MTIAIVSGGFDPIHPGHIKLMEHAATFGKLMVILNSDDWLIEKKGYGFMPWHDRSKIIEALKPVWGVSMVYDSDGSVCEALKRLRLTYPKESLIFCNGGDRLPANTLEVPLCKTLGIMMEYNVGGQKVNSSSELVERVSG